VTVLQPTATVAVDPLAAMVAKFTPAPTTADMAVVFRTPSAVNTWDLYQRMDDTFYSVYTLLGNEANSIRELRLGYCVVKVATSAGTRTGAGWSGPVGAGGVDPPPINQYYRTSTAGEYIEYTTPAGATIIGFAVVTNSNAGLTLVSIDGDATLANRVFTAQALVDAGTFPNTILVANGGTLNPTDRVVDQYGTTANQRIVCADNLTAGAHTIRLTCTGYKRAASSDVRMYIGGFIYGGAGINTGTANTELTFNAYNTLNKQFTYNNTVDEYALSVKITTTEWVGNGHGNETVTSMKCYIDTAETTLTNEYTPYRAASELKLTRVSTLTHTDVSPSTIGDATVNYILTPNSGLNVTVGITWSRAITILTGYMPMYGFGEDTIDKGSMVGEVLDYDLAGDPGTNDVDLGKLETQLCYAWDTDGTFAAAAYIPALASLDNWQYSTNKCFLQNRADGVINKMYFERWSNKAFTNETITSSFFYFLKNFPGGANTALAR
jgi:hypothetical protein